MICGENDMMDFLFGIIMFICIIPSTLLMYFYMYPKNWKKKDRVFGLSMRKEFRTQQSEEFIDIVMKTHKKQGTVIIAVILIVSVILLFVPVFFIKMIMWTLFIYVAIFSIMVPYALGNSELKRYKKNMGIVSQNITYADLKNAGKVHALNVPGLIFSNSLGILLIIISLLIELGITPFDPGIYKNSFFLTLLISSIILIGFIFIPIAFMVDNSKNQVISQNSDVNANYNRAKKKIFSDFVLSCTWIGNTIAFAIIISYIFKGIEIFSIIFFGLYLILIMSETFVYASKTRKLEQKYYDPGSDYSEDDDDHWILGMFYYNPNNKSLNVNKNIGVGMTVNMAHPIGKLFAGFGVLSLILSIVMLLWIALMGSTPIRLINAPNEIICHHLWDEYKINKDHIESVEIGDTDELKAIRVAGTGMENVHKGKYTVNGVASNTLFLNPNANKYIKIVTSTDTYYISQNTEEETEELYDIIKDEKQF